MEQKEKRMRDLEALYTEYADKILKVSLRICKDEEIAQNITNDVFLSLLTEIDNIDHDRILKWLMVTARNKTLNEIEKRKREVPIEDFEELMDARRFGTSAEDIVLDRFREEESKIRQEKLLDALYKKNERWYRAITMTYYLGMPQTKVAEKMGMSPNSLYALMNRAKAWIGEYYKEIDDDIL